MIYNSSEEDKNHLSTSQSANNYVPESEGVRQEPFNLGGFIMKTLNLLDRSYSISLQSSVLTAPIKDIEIEETKSKNLYKAIMVLEDGTKIWANFGHIGSGCYGAKGDIEKVKEGWRKELLEFWQSRNLAVLIEA
jgi:hypothetical protein